MKNIVIVGGIRTHYIKINAIQKVLKLYPHITKQVNIIYVDAAQHYDFALTGFKQELGVEFDYVLEHDTKDPFDRVASIFKKMGALFDEIQQKTKIDYVIVMGDVATTVTVALSAVMKLLPVVHIEGGVRVARGNGPEEYYRTAADHVSSLCFASTPSDLVNLQNEGFAERVIFSGDIIYDYIKHYNPTTDKKTFNYGVDDKLVSFDCSKDDYVLFSLHHVENLDFDTLQNTFTAVHETGRRSIFIAHPRVKRLLKELNVNTYNSVIADFVPYLDNLIAIAHCCYALTDSGGIQRETLFFGKRSIVRSDLTIWRPIVDKGINLVCSGEMSSLKNAINTVEHDLHTNFNSEEIFGDGNAVKTIFETLIEGK